MRSPGFQCSGCGSCCTRVGDIPDFPEPVNPDGSCSHLQADKSCGIYETRPDVCSVDKYYLMFDHQEQYPNIIDWYILNSEICNVFILEDGLDPGYLIDLAKYKKES